MIEYYESATHLNISFNKHIGTRGWQAAAHMMRKVGASRLSPGAWCHGPWESRPNARGCPASGQLWLLFSLQASFPLPSLACTLSLRGGYG